MDQIDRMGRMKEEEPHVKYKIRMNDFPVALIQVAVFYLFCSLASDCLYTVAINQTIISVSSKKASSCDAGRRSGQPKSIKSRPLIFDP